MGDLGLLEAARAAIIELLPRDASLPAVARKLGTAERTLQRRLAEHGTSHAELVDSLRRELARERVSSSTLTVTEVAALLGYADPSAFARAFRRWFGASPAAFRKG